MSNADVAKFLVRRIVIFIGTFVVAFAIIAIVSVWLNANGYWNPSVTGGFMIPAVVAWSVAASAGKKAKEVVSSAEEVPALDNLEAKAAAMMAETEQLLEDGAAQMAEFNSCTPEEQAWMNWHIGLSAEHKDIVDLCAERGIKATPENFDEILAKLVKATA